MTSSVYCNSASSQADQHQKVSVKPTSPSREDLGAESAVFGFSTTQARAACEKRLPCYPVGWRRSCRVQRNFKALRGPKLGREGVHASRDIASFLSFSARKRLTLLDARYYGAHEDTTATDVRRVLVEERVGVGDALRRGALRLLC